MMSSVPNAHSILMMNTNMELKILRRRPAP